MHKKFLIYLLAPVAMFIASCGGDKTEGEKKENGGSEEVNLDGMVGDDTLKEHGLNTTVWVPEELAPDGT